MDDDLKTLSLAFQATSPLVIADGEQSIINANAACVDLSGFSVEMICGLPLSNLYTPERNRFTRDAEAGFLAFLSNPGDRAFYSEKTVRVTNTGAVIHFIETITVVRDEPARTVNYVVNLQDVTSLVETQQALRESQVTYASLINSIHDGVVLLDKYQIIDCNEQFAQMLLSEKSSVVGRGMADISEPIQADGLGSQEKAAQVFSSVLGGKPGWVEWAMRRSDGRERDVEASLSPATLGGQPIVLATVRDITDRKKMDLERQELVDELAKKEEMIRLAGRASGVASWLAALDTGVITWSDGAAEALGFEPGSLSETVDHLLNLMPDDQSAEFENVLAEAVASRRPFKYEAPRRMMHQGQEELRWFNIQGQAEYGVQGEAVRFRGTVSDITDQKESEQEIARLAYHDPLTGLANRRLLLDRLQQSCSHAQRRGTSGALLFIDLDRFKLLNDSLGHQVGDELLKAVAQRLLEVLRKEDTVARQGGDEFVVLLPSIEGKPSKVVDRVRRIADAVRRSIARDYEINHHNYHMTASIGVAIFPQDDSNADLILQQADAAMYLAKKGGRDTVAFYHAALQAEADARLALEQELRNVIDLGQLELYFQAKVDVDDSSLVIGAEALLRWNHPVQGMIMPDAFIPVAEETGRIRSIGRWVLDSACEHAVKWNQGRDPDIAIGIAVNVSPVQFRHRNFVGEVQSIIDQKGLAPGLVTLEITEGTLIENLEDTQTKLEALRDYGVRISIDDFGTAYSSLHYLKNLPLDEIKIDRIYVKDIIEDSGDAAIVASILAIADNLALSTVAEGVETTEQASFLQAIGCKVHQGYLYAKPLPIELFTAQYLGAGKIARP